LPLVIETAAAVNVLEVGVEELDFSPAAHCAQPVQFLDRRHGRVRPDCGARATGGSRCAGREEELCQHPECRTVLPVIRYELRLPLVGVAAFPPLPPDDALDPGGLRIGPRVPEEPGDVLQSVRVTRE